MVFQLPLLALALTSAASAQGKNVTHTYGSSPTKWSACGELVNKTLECATIHVPMDHWAKIPNDKTFSIPLVRMLSEKAKAETILINPGGPGASGIDFLNTYGPTFDKIFEGNFHLLGFDPRGIAGSKPQAKCLPDDAQVVSSEKIPLGPLVPSEDWTLSVKANSGDFYAALSNYAKVCNETMGEHLGYINTPQTAADMNDILDSIGESKLNFYGGSYGTLLGAVYAQLFPDKIGRVALDGVLDYQRYWNTFEVADTYSVDDCWDELLGHCLKERATCSLADGFNNVTDLRAAIERKLDAMDLDPVGVYFNASAYGILRGSDVRTTGIFTRLYSPTRWPYMIRSLAYLLQDQYDIPYLHFFGGALPDSPRKKHNNRRVTVGDTEADSPDAQNLVLLGDKVPKDRGMRPGPTRKEVADAFVPSPGYLAQDFGIDETFLAATWLLPRTHDLIPAAHIKTASPVLLMSSKFDPVTPLRNAKAMNSVLQDSVLLVQDSIGHTTVSKPSKCTMKHMRDYFVDGVLPTAGTVCPVDDPSYFPDPELVVTKIANVEHQGEMTLDQALENLSQYPQSLAERHFGRL